MKRYYRKHPQKKLWLIAKKRAKKGNILFNIEQNDIIIPEVCPYLEVPLTTNGVRQANTASLDRIDPTKGYVKGNVEVVSLLANAMKQNATTKELVIFAKNVLKKSCYRK